MKHGEHAALLPFLTFGTYIGFLSLLYSKSLSGVRNQLEGKQQIFVFANGILLELTMEVFIHQTFIGCILCTRFTDRVMQR